MSFWILAFGVLVAACFTQAQKLPGADDPNSLANSRQADIAIVYSIGVDTKPKAVKRDIAPMLISMLDNADIDGGAVRVALVNFGTRSSVIFSLNTYQRKAQIVDAMGRFISPRQRSRISDPSTAIKTLKSRIFQAVHGDRPNVPNLVILVTDSPSLITRDYMNQVEELKNTGINIFTIGHGSADRTELSRAASQPSSLYSIFFPKNSKDDTSLPIKTSLARVINALRANPTEPTQAPSVGSSDTCRGEEMDLIFVIDSSTSVTEPNFKLIKDFLKFFLIPSDIDNDSVRVGIVIYSTRVKIQFQMDDYIGQKKEVYKAIDRINYVKGSTNTYKGLNTMRTQMFTPDTGDRPDVPNVCVLITDGLSNIFRKKTIPEAEAARNDGIHMYVIGIGLQEKKEEVRAIASKPLKDNLFTVDAFEDLVHLRELVFTSLQKRCGAPTPGPTPVYSDTGFDVIFMLDGSASNKYFGWMLGFAANFASQMSIDDGVWRVGAMTYSSGGPSLTFNLNEYGWKKDVVEAIQNNMNNNPGERPDLGQAFQYVRSNMFTAANGDRPNAINYVVVMTANDESLDRDATFTGAQALKDDRVGIYTVGINLGDTTELDTVTTKYIDEHQWLINKENEMSELPGIVIYNMENADPITLAPSTLAPTPVYSDTGFDVIFMLDGSASNKYFGWMLGFAANFASQMSIDDGVWRVGAMTYSSGGASLTFTLNEYGWKKDVVEAIQNNMNNSPGGRPDLGQAFQYVRSNMFTAANGDRPNAINYVVVMTANDESLDRDATFAGAQALKDDRVGIYTVGINLGDTTELDTVTTKFIDEHQWLINKENEMSELPGMIIYNMETADPITLAPSTLAPTPGYSDTGYDVIFMLDGSASNKYFGWMLGFAANFASQMSIDDGVWRVGAMTYSSGGPSLTFNLNEYGWKKDVVEAIQNNMNNSPGGRPDLGQAFQYVRSNMFTAANGDRPNAINYVVVMTANDESLDPDATFAGAQALKDDRVGIYTVGINLGDTTELDTVTTKFIDEHQWLINQENEMSELPGMIIYNMETADPITLAPSTLAPTPGYSDTGYDVIFMLDGSASNKYFGWMLGFAANFATQMSIDDGVWRVGAMTYSSGGPSLTFNLNEYGWKQDIVEAIQNNMNNSPGGRPDLGQAFQYVRSNMFTAANGDRPNAINYVVVMTANDESLDRDATFAGAQALKDDRVGIYTVGINLGDTTELDTVTTKYIDEHQWLINQENEMSELPGMIIYNMENADPVTRAPSTVAPTPSPTLGTSETGTDFIFMFDGTVNDDYFNWMRRAALFFASLVNLDLGVIRIGSMTFTDRPILNFNLNEYQREPDVMDALSKRPQNSPGGRPDLAGAFDFVRTNMFTASSGDRPKAQNFVILMTAGDESSDSGAARSASESLQRVGDSGTGIFSVGYNLDNTQELDAVTTKPLQDFRFIFNSTEGLAALPSFVGRSITKKIIIPEVTTPRSRVFSETGYDIILMFDGTANDEHFSWMKNLSKDLVSMKDIDSGEYRVGAMTYGEKPTLDFDLDEYGWQSDVATGISNKPQNSPGGRPDLAGAFDFVRTNMLTGSSGDRPKAQNFVVLMTASEESLDSEAARSASETLQRVGDSGTGIFSVGLNLDNTQELDSVTTKPLDQFQYLVNDEPGISVVPGRISNILPMAGVISLPKSTQAPTAVVMETTQGMTKGTGYDIILMFDGTVKNKYFSWMKSLANNLVDQLDIDSGEYRVGAVTFTDTPTTVFNLNDNDDQSEVTEDVTTKLKNSPGGRPDLAGAFDFVRTNMLTESSGDRPRAQNFVVLMTANEESLDSEAARSASETLQRVGDFGTGIFSVGLNLDNTQELDSVTTKPLDQFQYLVNGRPGLRKLPPMLKTVITSDPVISVPDLVPVSPTMKERAYSDTGKDIILMFDGTANDQHFSWMKNLSKDFVSMKDIDSGEYRVGAMTYGEKPTLDFDLDEYGWQSDVATGISNKPQNRPGGRPDLAGAFDFVRTNMLTESSGDRPKAQNFVVLMTASEESLDSEAARSASETLQRVGDSGTGIFSVGLNLDNTQELDSVTTKPLQDFRYLVNTPSRLKDVPGSIGAVISNPKGSKSVQVTSPDWAGKCGGSDVIFMLDGTVDPQTYRLFKNFAKNFTNSMDPSSDEFRVGGMSFTQSPSKGFHLNETNPIRSLDKLDSFNRPGGTPNLAQAIDIVNICMFTPENGDRPRADNYMIILTGSDSCLSVNRAAGAAKRFEETGGRIFTVGANLSNTGHLEAISSKPLDAYQYLVSSEADFGILPMALKATMRKPPQVTSSRDYRIQQVQHAASPHYTMTNRKGPIVVSLNLNFTLNNAP